MRSNMIPSGDYKYSRNICWRVTRWVWMSLQHPLMSLSWVLQLLWGSRWLLRRGTWLDYLTEHPSFLKRHENSGIAFGISSPPHHPPSQSPVGLIWKEGLAICCSCCFRASCTAVFDCVSDPHGCPVACQVKNAPHSALIFLVLWWKKNGKSTVPQEAHLIVNFRSQRLHRLTNSAYKTRLTLLSL